MKIGYAGMCKGVLNTKFRHCSQKYATSEQLQEIILHNFEALFHLLQYNVDHQIKLFRISSDFIPFASHPLNTLDWQKDYQASFEKIHDYVCEHDLRLSMHPGQYVVLNSTNPEVVERSIAELAYHAALLEAFQLDATHKMVLHIGGIYGDKKSAMERFVEVVQTCSTPILRHLVIENDDRYFTIEDVLAISEKTDIPVVYDQLHHELNPPANYLPDRTWIRKCLQTWKKRDGVMKIHYSQQAVGKRQGAHSSTINLLVFHQFFQFMSDLPLDWMIEVKDKNYSVNKINAYVLQDETLLAKEWQCYQYLIMEHSYLAHGFMKQELAMKALSPFWFYQYLDEALCLEASSEHQIQVASLFYEVVRSSLNQEANKKVTKCLSQLIHQKKSIAAYKKCLLQELSLIQSDWCENYYLTFDI